MSYLDDIFGLSGTTVVITGGGGAIAGSFAEALLRAGAKVALWGHHQSTIDERLEALAGKDGGFRARLLGVEVDTGEEEPVRRAIAATEGGLGAPEVLINGVGGNRGKSAFVDADLETFEVVLRLNLVAGLMVPTKVMAAYWIERRMQASIINLTSMASYVPLSGVWAYDAAKAAVLSLTQATAKEFAPHGIRVNSIAPGFFVGKQNRALLYDQEGQLTGRGRSIIDHTPYGRFGEVAELAGAVLFLASAKASGFVTGVSVPVDGGYLVHNI